MTDHILLKKVVLGAVTGLATGLVVGVAAEVWSHRHEIKLPQRAQKPENPVVHRAETPVKRERMDQRVGRVIPINEKPPISYHHPAAKAQHPSARAFREPVIPRSVSRFGFPPEGEEELAERQVEWWGIDQREWSWIYELAKREYCREIGGAPYPITETEYHDESGDYREKEHLYFFPNEGVLCDENENDLGLIDDITGPLIFGYGHGEPNKTCVRNERLETDYEVEAIYDESYYDWVERHNTVSDRPWTIPRSRDDDETTGE